MLRIIPLAVSAVLWIFALPPTALAQSDAFRPGIQPLPRQKEEIGKSLIEAEALLKPTGAESWRPFIHEERAELARITGDEVTRQRELREAQRLFVEIGAPTHAARIAKEFEL